MEYTKLSSIEFIEVLHRRNRYPAEAEHQPGGAIGTALGNMVGSLTVGKKKYMDVQEAILN